MNALIMLVLFLAGIAVVYWAINALSLPAPVKVIAIALLALVALVVIGRTLGFGLI